MKFITDKKFVRFVVTFLAVFCILYFGTKLVIGLSTPEGRYNAFVANYLDYITPLRNSLLFGTKMLLSLFGISSHRSGDFVLLSSTGKGIRMVYACLGYGVMSFWAAYIIAVAAPIKRKVIWILAGLFSLWLINVIRLSLVFAALQKGWPMPLGIDHHTWFNIVAYVAIGVMIWMVESRTRRQAGLYDASSPRTGILLDRGHGEAV